MTICAVDLGQLWQQCFAIASDRLRDDVQVAMPEAMPSTLVQPRAHPPPAAPRPRGPLPQPVRTRPRARPLRQARPLGTHRRLGLVRAVRTDGKAERPDYAARTLRRVY